MSHLENARICWCGNHEFEPFGPAYGECKVCETLVSLRALSQESSVHNEEENVYGKKYWLEHQQKDLGLPDLFKRSRDDLSERNLHWLKNMLKYCLPPADVLELGCAHGSFVALMGQAGYRGSGVEMSPWVSGFGEKTFGVRIYVGPVESLGLPHESLDVIALMDVLEHLTHPEATMRRCFELLKPKGLLLIQTPQFKEGVDFDLLSEAQDPFLKLLIPDEHLYLFSKHSITDLFRRLGAEYLYFEPAIFEQHDMFFSVSRAPLKTHDVDEMESALLATPEGRMVLALLDLRERELDLVRKLSESEADRAARLHQINELTRQINELTRMVNESEERSRELESSRVWRLMRRIGLV